MPDQPYLIKCACTDCSCENATPDGVCFYCSNDLHNLKHTRGRVLDLEKQVVDLDRQVARLNEQVRQLEKMKGITWKH